MPFGFGRKAFPVNINSIELYRSKYVCFLIFILLLSRRLFHRYFFA
ncbi:hypothetical protein SMA01_3828 [Salmonella enterica subsp. enterica serovar Manhattan str. 111113]|nr:hypothetical protein SMA01_3828 [Salmonella enterica subsp. enterica serovar Manhattan str. 111113]